MIQIQSEKAITPRHTIYHLENGDEVLIDNSRIERAKNHQDVKIQSEHHLYQFIVTPEGVKEFLLIN